MLHPPQVLPHLSFESERVHESRKGGLFRHLVFNFIMLEKSKPKFTQRHILIMVPAMWILQASQ